MNMISILCSNVKNIALELEEALKVPLFPQIVRLSSTKNVTYTIKGVKAIIRDPSGTSIEIGDSSNTVEAVTYVDKGYSWKPCIVVEINDLLELLLNKDLIYTDKEGAVVFNPLLIPIYLYINGRIVEVNPFSAINIEPYRKQRLIEYDGERIGLFKLTNRGINVGNGKASVLIELSKPSRWSYLDSYPNSIYVHSSNASLYIDSRRNIVRAEVTDILEIKTNWVTGRLYTLVPYFIASKVLNLIEENVFTHYMILLRNGISIHIVNPSGKKIVVENSRLILDKGIYNIVFSLQPVIPLAYHLLVTNLLEMEKIIYIGYSSKLDTSLLELYPGTILPMDYILSKKNIDMVLFNINSYALRTTINSLLPLLNPRIYTSRIAEGYTPNILKTNVLSFTIKPYSVLRTVFEVGDIGREVLSTRMLWRKVGKGVGYR